MKFDSQDFKRLQWALLFLAICLLVAGGAVWFALTLQKQTAQAHTAATAADKEIDSKISRARSEEQELRDKITLFQTLKTAASSAPNNGWTGWKFWAASKPRGGFPCLTMNSHRNVPSMQHPARWRHGRWFYHHVQPDAAAHAPAA